MTADANDTFDHNTMQTPVIANGIALYGGTDNTVSNNLIADPIREGSGIQLGSRFNAVPFTGSDWITDNTTVRAGTYELNWQIGLGAIWIYALQSSINADIEVVGDNFLDNTYDAMMVVSDYLGEGSLRHHQRAFPRHRSRRCRHRRLRCPLRRERDVPERRCPKYRLVGRQQLRVVPLPARPAPSSRSLTSVVTTASTMTLTTSAPTG